MYFQQQTDLDLQQMPMRLLLQRKLNMYIYHGHYYIQLKKYQTCRQIHPP